MSVAEVTTKKLECLAGHEWDWVQQAGSVPITCDDHRSFITRPLSPRLQPPQRVLREWDLGAEQLEEDDYVERWTQRWRRVVRTLAAREGSFQMVDPEPIEHYIRAVRMAEYHAIMAGRTPYVTSVHGAVKPHPGIILRESSLIEANRLAVGLGLEPEPEPAPIRNAPEKGNKLTVDDKYTGRLQSSADEHEEVTPFGEDL